MISVPLNSVSASCVARRFPHVGFVAAATLMLVVSGHTRADVIYNAFTGPEATGGAITTQFGAKYIALGFSTTATAYRLTSVDMSIVVAGLAPDPENPNPEPVPPTGTVVFSVYGADVSGFPPQVGSFIQNISGSIPVSSLPNGSEILPSYSLTGLSVDLSPSTNYYLVAYYPEAQTGGNFYWYQAFGVPPTNPAYDMRWSDSADGTTWRFAQANGSSPLKATINAVPEPATLGLAAITALGGLVGLRRRPRG